MIDIVQYRGCVAASGNVIDDMAYEVAQQLKTRDISYEQSQSPFHITLITKAELRSLSNFDLKSFKNGLQNTVGSVIYLGPGGRDSKRSEVLFVVIVWNAAQQARKKLGLPPKQFHITLTQNDDHTVDKGIDSLLHPVPSFHTGHLDDIAMSLMLERRHGRAMEVATDLCLRLPDSPRGYVRTGDIAIATEQYKLAILSFGRALSLDTSPGGKVEQYCLKRLLECAKHAEWGALFVEEEPDQLPQVLYDTLITPWPMKVRRLVADHAWSDGSHPSLCIDSRVRLRVPSSGTDLYELPRYFRWIVPFHFALMSTPRREEDIEVLSSSHLGIRHIVTLTEETPLPPSWFQNRCSITHTHLPIPNYHPPNIQQMDFILRLFSDPAKIPILVHCGGGKGRAGTVAACYIAAYGFRPPDCSPNPTQPLMSPSEAIAALRAIRPGSLETEYQEDFVKLWCSAIWKRRSILPELPIEPTPPTANPPLDIQGQLPSQLDLVVLVGLPGSGKSWFSSAILARSPHSTWRVVSQDEAGSRSSCETDIGRRGTGKVILDRCNPTASDRKQWLSLASTWAQHPICIIFDYSVDLCIARAQQRVDHPTLPIGGRVITAVNSIDKMMERPTLEEGFEAIITIRSFVEANELIQRISPAGLLKFPRTPHLIDLGAATEDDIVYSEPSLQETPHERFNIPGTKTVITEKIDGANMGLSLSFTKDILVQNRSHYVNPSSHQQFKKLGLWIDSHREALYNILDRDPSFPERYILYGEWMSATHSITYTNLPDYFVAFDLYDRISSTFLPRKTLDDVLSNAFSHTGEKIHAVPLVWEGSAVPDDPTLKDMVYSTSSHYGKGGSPILEGVYVKVEDAVKVLQRGKVVRGDFISGNEHWTKGQIRWNVISPPEEDVRGAG
ncbi:hypothetical protein FRC02_002207 [Tulasnella sp. 418]|nr:hypothetical protein FRC02_002207 [Tulasnella sp. 418]